MGGEKGLPPCPESLMLVHIAVLAGARVGSLAKARKRVSDFYCGGGSDAASWWNVYKQATVTRPR